MKSILLHVDADSCLDARLQTALDIARATNGHVTFLQVVNLAVFAPGDMYGAAMSAAIPEIKAAAEKLRAEIEADLANEDVSWEWRLVYGTPERRLLEQSALHDVILVGPHDAGEENSHGPSEMAGELALKAPVPVLVVPRDTKSFDTGSPVLVAWNGSSEACVALREAVPLLAMAGQVYVASVAEEDGKNRFDFPASEAGRYLSRHGIDCELVEIPRGKASISDTLASAATMRECGLMVMGAYGHSRLAEMLLGGVTRRSLSDPQLPILLAH